MALLWQQHINKPVALWSFKAWFSPAGLSMNALSFVWGVRVSVCVSKICMMPTIRVITENSFALDSVGQNIEVCDELAR